MKPQSHTLSNRVRKADQVFDMYQTWLSDANVVKALEDERNTAFDNHHDYSLDVHATVAAFFLFYMVTITEQSYVNLRTGYLLNTRLIQTSIDNAYRLQLTPAQHVKSMIECGLSINHGFVWTRPRT